MKRLFSVKMGLTVSDDRLPRILLKPFQDGGSAGKSPDFEKLKGLVYKYKDWDLISGKPSESKLKSLGLGNL